MTGGEVARISMTDDRGGEFFVHISAETRGRAFRDEKDRAIEAIMTAIEAGLEPGEVRFA